MTQLRFGIDLGGTKIELIALDGSGEEVLRTRVATPQGDYVATVKTVAQLVQQAEQQLGAQGSVGVGMPGAVSAVHGVIKNANSTCLNGQPLQQDLAYALKREVRLANDANCFALSEATDGAAAGAGVVFGVIIGTGVGGGIVVNGHVLGGANSIAGEWGHNPLPFLREADRPEPACYCGRHACIETYLSGPGMAQDHLAHGGEVLSAEAIALAASNSNAAAQATLERYIDRLARSLAHVMNILDPDVVVLGGGVSNIDALYREVPKIWSRYVFSDHVATRMVRNAHGDSSGVRGAAWLWND